MRGWIDIFGFFFFISTAFVLGGAVVFSAGAARIANSIKDSISDEYRKYEYMIPPEYRWENIDFFGRR